ncbi:YtxH domain-containing protein [Candidatus Saccharibacteria bacterium]|nr:YtxH domain-containing protein [Candidatus Saccharibacteria bacterium]
MSKGKFAFGAIVGAIAGVVAGVLAAPKSGKETREDLKKKAVELKDQAEKTKGAVKAKADDFSKDALSKADEMKSRAENAVQGAKDGFKKDPAAKK